MIRLCRAQQRRRLRRAGKHDAWLTFSPGAHALPKGFGALENIREDRLPATGNIRLQSQAELELITYVLEGSITHSDAGGRSGVLDAGEFQCVTAGRGIVHNQANASRNEPAHIFHIWLRSTQSALWPSCVQKRFSAAERRGTLCVVASRDGRRGSLLIHQDSIVYSALLDPGQHLVYELERGRAAWLHIVLGQAQLGGLIVSRGDGAGMTSERAMSLTAREPTEILLLDLAGRPNPRAEPDRAARESPLG